MDIIFATRNEGKVKEIEQQLSPFRVKVNSLLTIDEEITIEETGNTFEENAILKAETLRDKFHEIVISDDSGLSVDALDGRPGVYSARYAGENASDEENIHKLLQELRGVPQEDRTASFHCVIAIAFPGKKTITFTGNCNGYITETKFGQGGFGYDPVFYVPSYEKTMAELTSSEKNRISHRGKAITKLIEYWRSNNTASDTM